MFFGKFLKSIFQNIVKCFLEIYFKKPFPKNILKKCFLNINLNFKKDFSKYIFEKYFSKYIFTERYFGIFQK